MREWQLEEGWSDTGGEVTREKEKEEEKRAESSERAESKVRERKRTSGYERADDPDLDFKPR